MHSIAHAPLPSPCKFGLKPKTLQHSFNHEDIQCVTTATLWT